MTDAVGRSKIAKKKLAETMDSEPDYAASERELPASPSPSKGRTASRGMAMIVPMRKVYIVARQANASNS